MRCAVIGAGAWGTALADLLARNGHDVQLWAREPDVVESINGARENRRFLAGAALAPSLRATGEMGRALDDGPELIAYAAPSHVLRAVVGQARRYVAGTPVVAVATKGIEPETLAVMTDVARQELPTARVVALSGPSFAAEVAARQPTAIVAASDDAEAARVAQDAFSGDTFRVYTHDDVIGVELGGSLKNVIAVATGIAEGLGLGHNPRAALITRGLAEISRLGVALGAQPATFAGLAGLGDLVLTCTGGLSRNRSVGIEIGRGATLEAVLAGRETVAEGVTTARSALALARREGVQMPIVEAVCKVLFDNFAAWRAIAELMGRELRAERD
ncbi:MAG TPA: NAD(P)H-dependent glycerol-3-phosphate dehydrogenase [Gemmatimonadaceae bacterium]|nr:NAD(P)H-dependent glycerol-3-phosphate dehydrogenase [Gemmatimonadaceae bacterium]